MMLRIKQYFLILLGIFGFSMAALGQAQVQLQVPYHLQGEAGQWLSIPVHFSEQDSAIHQQQIQVLTSPALRGEYRWEWADTTWQWNVPDDWEGPVEVTFQSTDSAGTVESKAVTHIEVVKPKPKAEIDAVAEGPQLEWPDTVEVNHPITLKEGQEFELSGTAKGQDAQSISVFYQINHDSNLRSLPGLKVHIWQNMFQLQWTPTDEEAQTRFFNITWVAVDAAGRATRQTLHFQVMDVDQAPVRKGSLNKYYYLGTNQTLNIDYQVEDPDQDVLAYDFKMPIHAGNPAIDQEGHFQWTLNQEAIQEIRHYPVPVILSAYEMHTPAYKVEDTIYIYKSEQNAAPNIQRLSNLDISEGYRAMRRIFLEDRDDALDSLKLRVVGAPDWLHTKLIDHQWYLQTDTLPFDIVGVDGVPKRYELELIVSDPKGARDEKIFTVQVTQGVNTEDIYQRYESFMQESDGKYELLKHKIDWLDNRLQKHKQWKKNLTFTSFFLGALGALKELATNNTVLHKSGPYIGSALALSTGFSVFAFRKDDELTSNRNELERLRKKLQNQRDLLSSYQISGPTSEQLKNPEVISLVKETSRDWITTRNEVEEALRKFDKLQNQ